MDGITTHDHGGILRVSQESYRSWIGDGVDAAQLDVDFEAHVCKVLRLGLLALMALQALGRYSGLKRVASQVKKDTGDTDEGDCSRERHRNWWES